MGRVRVFLRHVANMCCFACVRKTSKSKHVDEEPLSSIFERAESMANYIQGQFPLCRKSVCDSSGDASCNIPECSTNGPMTISAPRTSASPSEESLFVYTEGDFPRLKRIECESSTDAAWNFLGCSTNGPSTILAPTTSTATSEGSLAFYTGHPLFKRFECDSAADAVWNFPGCSTDGPLTILAPTTFSGQTSAVGDATQLAFLDWIMNQRRMLRCYEISHESD